MTEGDIEEVMLSETRTFTAEWTGIFCRKYGFL